MGKKKHAEHVNHERWLVSYADLLTLLFAFFVVLFASSVSDKKKTAKMAAAMQTAFTEHGVFEAHSTSPPLESGGGNSQGAPAPLMEPVQMAPGADGGQVGGPAAKALQQHLQMALAGALGNGSATLHQSGEGITISLHEAGFFGSGTAVIDEKMMPLLENVAATLPDHDLRVEGHTDNQPIRNGRYRSNWELSTARASAIAEVLMARSHVSPAHFTLAGYGPFRPVAGNNTAEGRAQNRRVDIVLLSNPTSLPPMPDKTGNMAQGQPAVPAASPATRGPGSLPLPSGPLPTQHGTAAAEPRPAAGQVLQLATEADRAAAH